MKYVFALVLAIALFICPVSADADKLPAEYEDFANAIPSDVAELLPDDFFSSSVSDISDAVTEAVTPGYLLRIVRQLLSGGIGGAFSFFALLVGLAVLTLLLNIFTESVSGGTLKSAVAYGTSVCTVSAIVALQLPIIIAADEFFGRICIVMNSMIPVMTALYISGGNTAGAAVASSSLIIHINLIEIGATAIVIPSISVCMALMLADTMRKGAGSLYGIVGTIKKTVAFVFGLCSTLLMASLSAQNILATAGDNAGARAVKFVAGNMIPVVGSTVGETLRTIAVSVKLLRSTVGIAGLIVIALLLLPFLIELFLTRFSLNCAAAVAEILGCSNLVKLYRELGSLYGYIIAAAAMASLMCILSLTLFSIGSTAIGGTGL